MLDTPSIGTRTNFRNDSRELMTSFFSIGLDLDV